jgi:hypothetical protein
VRDGQVIAWDDGPHAVYRLAGITPGFRFMHVHAMSRVSPEAERRILAEKDAATHARYAVGDLKRLGHLDPTEIGDRSAHGRDLLPPSLSDKVRESFPSCSSSTRSDHNSGCGSGI